MESRCSKSLKLKRRKVSEDDTVGRKSEQSNDRFTFDTTVEDLDSFKVGYCPANTVKNNEWALRSFESWRVARNVKYSSEQCPSDLFATGSDKDLCDWLCRFVSEARKADGKEYMP